VPNKIEYIQGSKNKIKTDRLALKYLCGEIMFLSTTPTKHNDKNDKNKLFKNATSFIYKTD
jgi:hypothetical protein